MRPSMSASAQIPSLEGGREEELETGSGSYYKGGMRMGIGTGKGVNGVGMKSRKDVPL